MTLSVNYSFFGNGNWSIDATSGSLTGGGTVEAYVPEGSVIEAAYLYQSRYYHNRVAADMTMDGQVIVADDFTHLGSNGGMDAFRADVTDLVTAEIGNGCAIPFDFEMATSAPEVDGFQLVVVYSNPNEDERSIMLADGGMNKYFDSFYLTFPEAIDTTVDGFEALMSLGIGFGLQGTWQYSRIDVDGRRLTSSAGGSDDGGDANGGLITAGGLGDDPSNPIDPFARPTDSRSDDELYDLAQGNGIDETPFIANGATGILIYTEGDTHDDNIFFMGFNILTEAAANSGENDDLDARNDDYSVVFSRSLFDLEVRCNDLGVDQDSIPVVVGYDDSNTAGTVVMNDDGTFDYTPVYGFVGTDTFSYTISDGELTDTAVVTIQVDCPIMIADRAGLNYLEGCEGRNLMRGLRGDDEIHGNGGMDRIYGNADDDSLYGGAANDFVDGGVGNDWVDGGTEDDTLIGGRGADVMLLGEGSDTLRGGAVGFEGDGYADVFVLDTSDNGVDTITDFEVGLDLINLNRACYEVSFLENCVHIDIYDGGMIVLQGVSADDYASVDSIFVEDVPLL